MTTGLVVSREASWASDAEEGGEGGRKEGKKEGKEERGEEDEKDQSAWERCDDTEEN